ncbi:MAG: type IV pilus assembly protein PilP [Limisphaerales bacterium]|jgi:type IV pilus assembly protein PilP
MMRALPLMLVLSVALAGCTPNTDYSDLEQYMKEMDERTPGRIEPLPTIETVAPFAYQASTMRSPFEPPILVKKVDRKSGPKVTPDFNRVKDYLEGFTVGQLAMVGTLARGDTMFALIQDGEGSVTTVQSGDFMGSDHGQIQEIVDASMELIEIVADGTGGWVERARTVNLAGGA